MLKKLCFLIILSSSSLFINANAMPVDGRVDIWPTIPFIRGADLCRYRDAYGQTRTQFMQSMVGNATTLLKEGASGGDALKHLVIFNEMYDRNLAMATQYQYLDVTLESTFKAYLDRYYRDLKPRTRKLSLTNVNDILSIVNLAINGQREGHLDNNMLAKLDYVAYGSYALAPSCAGDIQVTLHLVGKNGETKSYVGSGKPETVMGQIALEMFSEFQGTQFPSSIKIGNKMLTLVGGLNGSVDRAYTTEVAAESCATLDARLPTQFEIELLSGYGDWSGGVSLNNKIWAMANGMIYVPYLKNPSPVRLPSEVNQTEYFYYCVK